LYPRTYYETFMRYEASDEVFVAMPFTPPFQRAFEATIAPAIERVTVNGKRLKPRIINRGTSGSPDIHEKIFDAILHSRLVLADMTVQASYSDANGRDRWQANANVAYEVGLASAWRNPEDILLIHQGDPNHTYGFDIQNLRHVEYLPRADATAALTTEIVDALNHSTFLARLTYQKILESVSPSAIQFMHQEVCRVFPVVAFQDRRMPLMDARIHAAAELLECRALKNRNVIRQGDGKGVAVIYEWTELGLRMLGSLHAASADRRQEMAKQIASVEKGKIPPAKLRALPEPSRAPSRREIDMDEALRLDTTSEPASEQPPPSPSV